MTQSTLRQHRAEKLSNFENVGVVSHDSAALSRSFSDARQHWAYEHVQRGGKSSAQQCNGVGARGGVQARGKTLCSVDLAGARGGYFAS